MKISERQQIDGATNSRQIFRSGRPWSARAKLMVFFALAWLVLTVYGTQVWWIGNDTGSYVDHLCALLAVFCAAYLVISRPTSALDAAADVATKRLEKSPLTPRTRLLGLLALSAIYLGTWWAVGPAVSALTTIAVGAPAVSDANLEKIRETGFRGKGEWSCPYKVDLVPNFGSSRSVEWCAREADVQSLKIGTVQLKGYQSRLGFKVAEIVPANR